MLKEYIIIIWFPFVYVLISPIKLILWLKFPTDKKAEDMGGEGKDHTALLHFNISAYKTEHCPFRVLPLTDSKTESSVSHSTFLVSQILLDNGKVVRPVNSLGMSPLTVDRIHDST